jgi:hypothetical protein
VYCQASYCEKVQKARTDDGPETSSCCTVPTMGMFLRLLHVIGGIFSLLVYGYCELTFQYGAGIVISAAIAWLMFRKGLYWYPFVLLATEAALKAAIIYTDFVDTETKKAAYVPFFLLLLYAIYNANYIEEPFIYYRPKEKEIRQLLFKHDHKELHKVDKLLDGYRGREGELLEKLKNRYITKTDSKRSSFNNLGFGSPWGSSPFKPLPSSTEDIQQQIRELFISVDPEMVKNVPTLLQRYAGKESFLLESLCNEYGVPVPAPKVRTKMQVTHTLCICVFAQLISRFGSPTSIFREMILFLLCPFQCTSFHHFID